MLEMYPACFIKEKNGYSVVFPDLNYLATQGDDMRNAMEMAVECLAGYLFDAKIEHEEVNKPSKYSDINIVKFAKEYGIKKDDVLVLMVSVDVDEYAKKHFCKAVKKTLTIPKWLNDECIKRNINFSKVLKEALISEINA